MKGIDRTTIKIAAMVSMLFDHVGYRLILQNTRTGEIVHEIFHSVGRMAFPLFLFLLVDGFFRSRSRAKYFMRLFIAAVISEVPYDLFLNNRLLDFSSQNVMWTMLFLFAYMWTSELFLELFRKNEKIRDYVWPGIMAQILLGYIFVIGAFLFRTDYSGYGVIAGIIVCSFKRTSLRNPKLFQVPTVLLGYLLMICFMTMLWGNTIYALPTALLVYFYNGRCMIRMPRWIGYAFYPAHMLVIFGLARLLYG